MKTLAEEIHVLFDEDENVKEWIILGKLPPDIAEIVVEAIEPKGEKKSRSISLFDAPKPYLYIATLIQKKFWPDAPPLEKGGFMAMLGGGPAPAWVIMGQVSDQICDQVKEHGYEVVDETRMELPDGPKIPELPEDFE